LHERLDKHFTPAVYEQDHAADIAYVEKKAGSVLAFLSVLDARWRSIRSRWASYRLPTYQPTLLEQATELKQVDRLAVERKALEESGSVGCRLFGDAWQGERS